jgi:NAD(P)-dependent dehydrogenase (short-subunit alcohol dehydrogenase family)
MPLPRAPSFHLDGRRALVAGASSGIGVATAVAPAEQGAEVTLCARRKPGLRALATKLQAGGIWAEILPPDITDAAAVEGAFAARPAFDVPDKSVCDVEDIMVAVAALASDAAALITGTSLVIDGSWTADCNEYPMTATRWKPASRRRDDHGNPWRGDAGCGPR